MTMPALLCVEIVNITQGRKFIAEGEHRRRPEKTRECELLLQWIESVGKALPLDIRTKMDLSVDDEYLVVESTARVSDGIGQYLSEETRFYGSLYIRTCKEFRQALFGDTVFACDISCAYPTFMRILSKRHRRRLEEVVELKQMVRAMIACAYRHGRASKSPRNITAKTGDINRRSSW